jgi:Tol biopolymer transport system component
MAEDTYEVFISYRRQYDSETALLLRDALTAAGFEVFIDREGLKPGLFDKALLARIAATPNFVVILSERSLDRRGDPNDYFCREIAQAIRQERNIIPVMMPEFEFPPESELAEGVKLLPGYNGVRYSRDYPNAAVEKIIGFLQETDETLLERLLKSLRRRWRRLTEGRRRRAARAPLAALGVLLLAAACLGAYMLWPRPAAVIKTAGSPRNLTGLGGEELAPSFSPDGGQVVYVADQGTGKFDLYVKLLGEDVDPMRLTETEAVEHSPAWSPAGGYIAYLREPASPQEKWGFYKVPTTGHAEVRLADAFPDRNFGGRIKGRCISWSNDGRHLAVMDKHSASEPFRIYLIPAEPGGEAVPLTDPHVFPGDSNPAFSPDGRTLAFTRAASTGTSNIYLLRLREGRPDGEPIPVTDYNKWVSDIAWTPDGSHLIFSSSHKGGIFTLWMLPAVAYRPGVEPEAIGLGESLFGPAVSSKWELAFSYFRIWNIDLLQYDLTRPTGAAPRQPSATLAPAPSWEISPSFSSDGEKISFASDRTGSREIYVYERKTARLLTLTRFGGADTGSPRLSPDGTRVAFDSEEQGNRDIYVVRAAAQESPRPLVAGEALDVRPSWSADGKWVYFGSNRTGKTWQVWKVPAEGGQPVQVTKGGGREAFASPDGEFVYYAKEMGDHWELWRVPTAGGEETPVLGRIRQGFWAVTRKGIYYLSPEGVLPLTINLYRFDTRRDEPTGIQLDKELTTSAPGLAVAPDDSILLLQQEVQRQSNIMVVKLTHD